MRSWVRSTSAVQKQKWVNRQKLGVHMSVRDCKKSSSRCRTEELSDFCRLFLSPPPRHTAHPFPAKLHFFPPLSLSAGVTSTKDSCSNHLSWFSMHLVPDISFLIASYANALPVGTFYVRALVDTLAMPITLVDTCGRWTSCNGLVSGPWLQVPFDSEFSTQLSLISSGWIKCLLFSLPFCPAHQIYEPAAAVKYK